MPIILKFHVKSGQNGVATAREIEEQGEVTEFERQMTMVMADAVEERLQEMAAFARSKGYGVVAQKDEPGKDVQQLLNETIDKGEEVIQRCRAAQNHDTPPQSGNTN